MNRSILNIVSTLESSLGLSGEFPSSLDRTLECVQVIKKLDDKKAFYFDSFQKDSLFVAEIIINLIDELKMSGWEMEEVGEKRINDLAKIAKNLSLTSLNERLNDVKEVLAVNLKKSLPQIDIDGEISFYPKRLQDVLSNKLVSSSLLLKKAKINNPDITIIKSNDFLESQRLFANFLLLNFNKWNEIAVVVDESSKIDLKNIFDHYGIPFSDSSNLSSTAHSYEQLILTYLEMVFLPRDPQIVLRFLSVNHSPIKFNILRYNLIDALTERPSLDSDYFQKAIEKSVEYYNKNARKGDSTEKLSKEDIKALLDNWFADSGVPEGADISLNIIESRISKLAQWFTDEIPKAFDNPQQKNSLFEAKDLLINLKLIFQGLSQAAFNKDEFHKVLLDTLDCGLSICSDVAKNKGPRIYTSPLSIETDYKTILWFDFSFRPGSHTFSTFWDNDEILSLTNKNINLLNSETWAMQKINEWSYVFARSKELICFFPQRDVENAPNSLHPLYYQMIPKEKAAQLKWNEDNIVNPIDGANLKSVAIREKLLQSSTDQYKWSEIEPIDKIKIKPLDKVLIDEESYSNLKLISTCSLRYVFEKQLKLSSVDSEVVDIGNKIYGIIFHDFIEAIYKKGEKPVNRQDLLESLIKKNATMLNSTSFRQQKNEFISIVLEAHDKFHDFLLKNKLEVLESEAKYTKPFLDKTLLKGYVDIILGRDNSPLLILDFKWSGGRYKTQELKNKNASQLAIYSHLVSSKGTHLPVGYFIVDERVIYTSTAFKDAVTVEASPSEMFDSFTDKIILKIQELKTGTVTVDGNTEDNDKTKYPADCRFCDYQNLCGKI